MSYLVHPMMRNVIYLPDGKFTDNVDPTRSVEGKPIVRVYLQLTGNTTQQEVECLQVLQ